MRLSALPFLCPWALQQLFGLAFAPAVGCEELLGKAAFLFLPFPLLPGKGVESFLGLLQSATTCLVEPHLKQRPTVVGC